MKFIVCAAIKKGELICVGKNHAAIIHEYFRIHNQKINGIQGFIDSCGDFQNRQDAYKIALASGQIEKGKTSHKEDLFSEDL